MNSSLATIANNAALVCVDVNIANTALNTLSDMVEDSQEYFLGIADGMSCRTINPLYSESMYEILCGSFLDGLAMMWAFQCTASVFLFLALTGFPCASIKRDEYSSETIAPEEHVTNDHDLENQEKSKAIEMMEQAAPEAAT